MSEQRIKPSTRICLKCGNKFTSSKYDHCYNCRPKHHNILTRTVTPDVLEQDIIEFDKKVEKLRRLLAKIRRHQKYFITTNEASG